MNLDFAKSLQLGKLEYVQPRINVPIWYVDIHPESLEKKLTPPSGHSIESLLRRVGWDVL